MIEAFASISAAMLFWATVGVWGIGERALTVRRDLHAGAYRSRSDAGSYYWILAGVLSAFVAGFALAGTGILSLPGPALWLVLGLMIAWTGMLLRWWSVLTLDELFTTKVMVQEDQRVVRQGPYRFVRHPSTVAKTRRRPASAARKGRDDHADTFTVSLMRLALLDLYRWRPGPQSSTSTVLSSTARRTVSMLASSPGANRL